jgi:hypothetical protein
MLHQVKQIGANYENISLRRNDKIKFSCQDFLKFAETFQKKYCLLKENDGLYVSTFYSETLLNDFYKQTIYGI